MSKSKGKEDTATGAILTYLKRQNRPYSAVDIFNNLHKEFGKTAVTKSLENLAQDGLIKEKCYGKQKVYVFSQDDVPTADSSELRKMDQSIQQMTESMNKLQTEVTSLSNTHKKLASHMTLDEAKQKLSEVKEDCKKMEEKLSKLRGGQVLISKEEKDKVYSERNGMTKEWKKRKRLANDILNAILEGYPKSKKALYEDIGIETDEECKVTMPAN